MVLTVSFITRDIGTLYKGLFTVQIHANVNYGKPTVNPISNDSVQYLLWLMTTWRAFTKVTNKKSQYKYIILDNSPHYKLNQNNIKKQRCVYHRWWRVRIELLPCLGKVWCSNSIRDRPKQVVTAPLLNANLQTWVSLVFEADHFKRWCPISQ